MFWVIGITVLATVLLLVFLLNFKTPEKVMEQKVGHRHAVSDPQFRREMSVLLGPSIVGGNRVSALQNGNEIFPAMLQAIRSAQTSITFETHIYWSGRTGDTFADALSERARSGVRVSVIIDWVGSSKIKQSMLDALVAACGRGVRVRILLPGPYIDSLTVKVASKHDWGVLLRAGALISVYQPTMLHTKLMVIDAEFVSVGSTNFDMRSIRLNDEASLNIYDHGFASKMAVVFETDLQLAVPYSLDRWRARPLRDRLYEKVLLPIRSQL
ncbi:hypothetical protein K8B33_15680 [Alcanivorax sp. JB21]|uniref:phospholipase D-like domain-containing protein n=1 Tax=Alcanivorax limicola TaxID=2874102 RepID=UPI001CBEBCD6|nr:phospholipase D-like domain-containing protein [Alcanivorax limicola]MBZ2190550.1 hypothetical protein [Alcanivorax limicola]